MSQRAFNAFQRSSAAFSEFLKVCKEWPDEAQLATTNQATSAASRMSIVACGAAAIRQMTAATNPP